MVAAEAPLQPNKEYVFFNGQFENNIAKKG